LSWALLAAFDPGRGGRVPVDLGRQWQVARESPNLAARPIERFGLAGTLDHHPGQVRSGPGGTREDRQRELTEVIRLGTGGQLHCGHIAKRRSEHE
jgi:hypothetical protein